MNNTYEVHCSGLIKDELIHDYSLIDADGLALYRSYGGHWSEDSRGEIVLDIKELNNGISVML